MEDKFYEEFKKAFKPQKKQQEPFNDNITNAEGETLELRDGGVSEDEGYVLENDNPQQNNAPDFLER